MPNLLSHPDRTILLNALTDADQFATVRGRQTIVRNALAGYPMSAEVDKALRFLDWEGAPLVVADALLRLIEGHEPAPGVPALALIAQAIEPVSSMAQRKKLADLRRRMGWGGSDPSSSAETWRDYRPPADVNQERIIGENTLRPLYYLRRALLAAEAVVRIDLNGQLTATGFLVAPDLMVTNHHVIADEQQAQSARAYFFDEVPDRRDPASRRQPAIASAAPGGALLFTDRELDVTLVRLQGSPRLLHYLPLRPNVVKQNDRVVIIQHPGGYPKQISLQNNLVAHADARIVQYYTSTYGGSSGSPVLDDDFAVVAVHHGWVYSQKGDAGQIRFTGPKRVEDLQYRNEGTSVIALLEDLKKAAPALAAELTVLRD